MPQFFCAGDVHVWALRLEAPDHRLAECFSSLSSDERHRSGEFKTEQLKKCSVLSRAILRILLGSYLGIAPREVQLSYGRNGKPSVSSYDSLLRFNVAHSGNLAVYSFAMGCEVGIDVERIRDVPDMEGIARHFFSPEEAAELERVAPPERTRSFFACWTRKEAYIKATGEGLSAELHGFRVTLRPSEPAALLHINGDAAEASLWSMHELRPVPGYIGALAFRGDRRLRVSPCQSVEQLLANPSDPVWLRE